LRKAKTTAIFTLSRVIPVARAHHFSLLVIVFPPPPSESDDEDSDISDEDASDDSSSEDPDETLRIEEKLEKKRGRPKKLGKVIFRACPLFCPLS
jgi:hypothetical protein